MAKKSKKKKKQDTGSKKNGIILLITSLLVFISFITTEGRSVLGPVGEIIARLLYLPVGKAAYIIPFITLFLSVNILRKDYKYLEAKAITGFLIFLLGASVFLGLICSTPAKETFVLEKVSVFYSGPEMREIWNDMPEKIRIMNRHKFFTAGYAGEYFAEFLSKWFRVFGAYIITALMIILSVILLGKEKIVFNSVVMIAEAAAAVGKGTVRIIKIIGGALADFFGNLRHYIKEYRRNKKIRERESKETGKNKQKKEKPSSVKPGLKEKEAPPQKAAPQAAEKKKKEKINIIGPEERPKKPVAVQSLIKGDYKLPSSELLKSGDSVIEPADYSDDAERLKKTLKDFGIAAEVLNVVDGPVISRFEVELATGIKVSRVENLAQDIALAMTVEQVRIAPVPGKSLLGIEVPKRDRKIIYLKDIIEDENFYNAESLLSLAIGKDLGGRPVVAQLQEMPHLLIAGATGSGKSVCINSIIMSILFKASPDEVKLLLVDPKRVELTNYRDLPHLVAPVITDAKHAAYVLKRLIAEMDYRYDVLSEEGAQNINIYNKMVEEYNEQVKSEKDASEEDLKKTLPYIVLIIDELADLMMLAKGSVEDSLRRLAQLARAVGIHLVLATQRPSVDVITGVIKANFPSRIAFQVMSQVDSRTIIDTKGADSLLGRGDMLYAPADVNKPLRGQAAFVSQQEISKVVHFIKKQRKPEISEDFQIKDKDNIDLDAIAAGKDTKDSGLLEKGVEIAAARGEISTSYLQRKLGIGYSKAARLIDDMEEKGIISQADGNKPRKYTGEG